MYLYCNLYMKKNKAVFEWLLLILYSLLTFVFAAIVPLSYDESYYFTWSKQLAWGYFDHPPMVALLIRVGTFFYSGELGVRLFFILLHLATIVVLTIIAKKYQLRYSAITFSFRNWLVAIGCLFLFQLTHFFATPDIPLLFFSALWLLVYFYFLQKPNFIQALLLGAIAAAMFYSKYHAVLFIGFILLSNLSLLRSGYFYIAIIFGALLYMPHICWQYTHDFPTINYHFLERSSAPYHWSNTIIYLLSQIVVVSPALLFLIYKIRRVALTNLFLRGLYFVLFGVLIFFLLMSLKGTVEAHWTLILSIPVVLLIYLEMLSEEIIKLFYKIVAFTTTIFVLLLQIEMKENIVSPFLHITNEFYDAKDWAMAIQKKCNTEAVIFVNSYQHAARYTYYSQHTGWSVNNLFGRKNQYSLSAADSIFMGKNVAIVSGFDFGFPEKINVLNDTLYVKKTDSFCFYEHIAISAVPSSFSVRNQSHAIVTLTAKKRYDFPIFHTTWQQPQVQVNIFQGNKWISFENTDWIISEKNYRNPYTFKFKLPQKSGKYNCYFSIVYAGMPAGFNSPAYPITVK